MTAVEEGETFEAEVMHGGERSRETYTVGPKCDRNEGRWYCVTHDELFANQLQKDGHIHSGKHRLTWVCLGHGPEVP